MMNRISEVTLLGILLLVTGIAIFSVGMRLVRKFRTAANYTGIGGFRFTREGVAWLAGYLLVVFGLSAVFVSVMLLLP